MEKKEWSITGYGELWEKMEMELSEVKVRKVEVCYPAMMRVVKSALREMRVGGLIDEEEREYQGFLREEREKLAAVELLKAQAEVAQQFLY